MSSWLRRLFSRTFRNALAAEAAGDYTKAAEHYALAGQPAKVAEMHLVRSRRVDAADRADVLDDALRWLKRCDEETEVPETLIDELAEALVEEARALPEGDPRRRHLATEAGRLHEEAARFREAGEAYELAGDKEAAVRCYETDGHIEGMERLLDEESRTRAASRVVGEAFDAYEAALASGARDKALAALRRCCAESSGQGYERMLSDLEKRFPTPGAVDLRVDGVRYVVVGATPAILGRGDAHVRLRHAGISRRHAAIDVDAGFYVRDAGSRNGTLLSGLPVAGRLPLTASGTIGLGDQCTLQYAVGESGDFVELDVLDGPDRGLHAVVVAGAWSPPSGVFRLRFREGLAIVEAQAEGGGRLLLNEKSTNTPVVLLVGDTVQSPAGGRIEVAG